MYSLQRLQQWPQKTRYTYDLFPVPSMSLRSVAVVIMLPVVERRVYLLRLGIRLSIPSHANITPLTILTAVIMTFPTPVTEASNITNISQ